MPSLRSGNGLTGEAESEDTMMDAISSMRHELNRQRAEVSNEIDGRFNVLNDVISSQKEDLTTELHSQISSLGNRIIASENAISSRLESLARMLENLESRQLNLTREGNVAGSNQSIGQTQARFDKFIYRHFWRSCQLRIAILSLSVIVQRI